MMMMMITTTTATPVTLPADQQTVHLTQHLAEFFSE
jgi:hypothetical protein